MMNRRKAIKLCCDGLVVAGAGYFGLKRYSELKVSNFWDVDAAAEFINSRIVKVDSHRDNGGKLVVFFPDLHYSFVHRMHLMKIFALNRVFDLKHVGIESSYRDRVDFAYVEELFQEAIQGEKEGRINQLAFNEAKFFKQVPEPLSDIDHFLEIAPLYKLTKRKDYFLYGLEERASYDEMGILVDSGKTLDHERVKQMNLQRSNIAVKRAIEHMEREDTDRTIMVYGMGHKKEIIEEMERRKLSYIVTKYGSA